MREKMKVLIADDIQENREVLKRQVLQMGHRPTVAADGLAALAEMERDPPDLILLDISMPGMDGITLLKILKRDPRWKEIPVIMISGMDEMDAIATCIRLGAEDYLVKPPNLTILKARIFSGLSKKATHDREIKMLGAMESFNLHLQERVSEAEQKLSAAYLDTLNRLVVAAEYKDEDTGEHLARMSRYSALLAQKAALSSEDVQDILFAAPLHDVGKIGVPDHILLKRGKLSDEEFGLMKNHTIIGSQILKNSQAEIIQVAHQIALTHHERWDGAGYPHGLKGQAIPLVGRIVAIVDTFDALTSRRPYKDPYPVEVTCEIMRKERGRQFDPHLLDLLLAETNAFLEIRMAISGGELPETDGFGWSERDMAAGLTGMPAKG